MNYKGHATREEYRRWVEGRIMNEYCSVTYCLSITVVREVIEQLYGIPRIDFYRGFESLKGKGLLQHNQGDYFYASGHFDFRSHS